MRQRWEYLLFLVTDIDEGRSEWAVPDLWVNGNRQVQSYEYSSIQEVGLDGWELVSHFMTYEEHGYERWTFKRPVEE